MDSAGEERLLESDVPNIVSVFIQRVRKYKKEYITTPAPVLPLSYLMREAGRGKTFRLITE